MSDNHFDLNNFDIKKYLLHRYPFLLVDGVAEINIEQSILAHKNVSYNEWFFQGHFPENPVFPGVLILEALAQAACVLMIVGSNIELAKSNTYLTNIEKASFKRLVKPGDKLDLYVNVNNSKKIGNKYFVKFAGQAKVKDELACACEFSAVLIG